MSKGRVVADGPLDEIRARSGAVRYVITVDERSAQGGSAPTLTEVENALSGLSGVKKVRELPTDETEHRLELSGSQDTDLRAEIFRLAVAKGWTLLGLRRDALSLDAVFRDLTRGDEALDRGRSLVDHSAADEAEDSDEEPEEDDDDDDDALDSVDEDKKERA